MSALPTRWKRLTLEQLTGAEYALRVIHTSPVLRGAALEVVKEQLEECWEEFRKRQGAASPALRQPGNEAKR